MPDPDMDSEELRELVARTRVGDRAAEDRLIRAVLGRFQNLARRMLNRFPDLRQWEQTGDVAQDALLRLLRALRTVSPKTTRDFFNLGAEQIRRQLLDLARQYRRAPVRPLPVGDPSDDGGDPPAPVATDLERWENFHEAVAKLPAELREVVGLTFYHGWTQARIAELFAVDERTIRRRWQSACRTLDKELGGQLPGL
jgi:RNA polymerase sigma-70 factor (ECF subfamily)